MTKLGTIVRDTVTGYTGLAMARAVYLHGCIRVLVTPKELDKEGKPREGEWFDEDRLGVSEGAGGPERREPSRSSDAPR